MHIPSAKRKSMFLCIWVFAGHNKMYLLWVDTVIGTVLSQSSTSILKCTFRFENLILYDINSSRDIGGFRFYSNAYAILFYADMFKYDLLSFIDIKETKLSSMLLECFISPKIIFLIVDYTCFNEANTWYRYWAQSTLPALMTGCC